MDFGYITHAVHSNSRLVYLRVTLKDGILTIRGPPDGNIYPPGPGWLHVVVDGIPSEGMKVMVGSGKGPAVDEAALRKFVSPRFSVIVTGLTFFSFFLSSLLANSAVDQYEAKGGDGSE